MEIIKTTGSDDWKVRVKTILDNNGVIGYPTDTCFALGCYPDSNIAITKLLEFKERVLGRAIPIAVSTPEMAQGFVEVSEPIMTAFKNFTPGPITIVSKSKGNIDPRLPAENGTLAIRMPNFAETLELIEFLGKPLITTIASDGSFMPYSVESILEKLPESKINIIDAILDPGYELPHNPPSTVLDFSSEELVVHRSGRINPLELEHLRDFESSTVEETVSIGQEVMNKATSYDMSSVGIVLLLDGQMGAGKTHLTKGIAQSLGIDKVVKSPTYNYINEYKLDNGGKLIHIDAWRIQEKNDLDRLKLKDYFKPENVVVIEWSAVISALDPQFFDNLPYFLCEIVVEGDRRTFKLYRKNTPVTV